MVGVKRQTTGASRARYYVINELMNKVIGISFPLLTGVHHPPNLFGSNCGLSMGVSFLYEKYWFPGLCDMAHWFGEIREPKEMVGCR